MIPPCFHRLIIQSIFELILEHPLHTWQDYSTGPWHDIWMMVALLPFYSGLCIIKWWIDDFLNAAGSYLCKFNNENTRTMCDTTTLSSISGTCFSAPILLSFSSFICSLLFLSAFFAWSLAKQSTSYLDQEAESNNSRVIGTPHQHAEVHLWPCAMQLSYLRRYYKHAHQAVVCWLKILFQECCFHDSIKDTLGKFSQMGILFCYTFIN